MSPHSCSLLHRIRSIVGHGVAILSLALLTGCGPSSPSSKTEATNPPASNPANAPFDYLSAQGKALRTAERTVSIAELQQAIQKFQAMEDRWPKDLNELVQQRYLDVIPTAPRGQRFQYNPTSGQVRSIPAPITPEPITPKQK